MRPLSSGKTARRSGLSGATAPFGRAIPGAAVPDGFGAELRPYQVRGVDWLQFLRRAGLGGVLADDMGLGKTVQTLAHLLIEKEEGRLDRPALILCPTSLVPNWRMEAARFAPSLPRAGFARTWAQGAIRRRPAIMTGHHHYRCSGATTRSSPRRTGTCSSLDEAQMIKNPRRRDQPAA